MYWGYVDVICVYIYITLYCQIQFECLAMASIPPLVAIKHIREMTDFNHWIVLGGYLGT